MISNRKSITTFIVSFLVVGFLFLALPQTGNAGFGPPPGGMNCCQLDDGCFDIVVPPPGAPGVSCSEDNVFPGAICNEFSGQCQSSSRNVPTLSEWGLIAMAGVLGLIGFIVIRRKRATA